MPNPNYHDLTVELDYTNNHAAIKDSNGKTLNSHELEIRDVLHWLMGYTKAVPYPTIRVVKVNEDEPGD